MSSIFQVSRKRDLEQWTKGKLLSVIVWSLFSEGFIFKLHFFTVRGKWKKKSWWCERQRPGWPFDENPVGILLTWSIDKYLRSNLPPTNVVVLLHSWQHFHGKMFTFETCTNKEWKPQKVIARNFFPVRCMYKKDFFFQKKLGGLGLATD